MSTDKANGLLVTPTGQSELAEFCAEARRIGEERGQPLALTELAAATMADEAHAAVLAFVDLVANNEDHEVGEYRRLSKAASERTAFAINNLRDLAARAGEIRDATGDARALDYYRAAVEGRAPRWVPSRIRLLATLRGDFPFGHSTVAPAGDYDCECNQWGAVSIRCSNGQGLGVKPAEFEPIAWRAAAQKQESAS